jgi:hypothetical protein
MQALNYPWQQCYLAALMELDKIKLAEKLVIANEVIRCRILENNAGPEEQQAITDALHAMKTLHSSVAGPRFAPGSQRPTPGP